MEDLLRKTNYNEKETKFLIKGFRTGFSLKYRGPKDRQDQSQNNPFTPGLGNETEMWSKIMKEVKLG